MEKFMSRKEKISLAGIVILTCILLMALVSLDNLEKAGRESSKDPKKIEISVTGETYQEYLKSLTDKKIEIVEYLSSSDRVSLYGTLKKVYSEGIVIHTASKDPNSRYIEVFIKQDLIKWIVATEEDLQCKKKT